MMNAKETTMMMAAKSKTRAPTTTEMGFNGLFNIFLRRPTQTRRPTPLYMFSFQPDTSPPDTSPPVTSSPSPPTLAPIDLSRGTQAPIAPTASPTSVLRDTLLPTTPVPSTSAAITSQPSTSTPVTEAPSTPVPSAATASAQSKAPINTVMTVPRSPMLGFDGVVWSQVGENIVGSNNGDLAGSTVAMNGNGTVVAVTSLNGDAADGTADAGFVRVFVGSSTTGWTQLGSNIEGGVTRDDQFGTSLAISDDGTVVAIGTPVFGNVTDRNKGIVKVFAFVGSDWAQVGQTFEGLENNLLGSSVSLSNDGSILAIGSPGINGVAGVEVGRVSVYQVQNAFWVAIGGDIEGEVQRDGIGNAVALNGDGTIVAIGSGESNHPTEDGSNHGYVAVYSCTTSTSGQWQKVGDNIRGVNSGDRFGSSVAMSDDGQVVAGGAPNWRSTTANNVGQVRVFENSNGVWTQVGQDLNGEAAADDSGEWIDLSSDGSVVAIAAIRNNAGGIQSVGHVRVFQVVNNVWTLVSADIDGQDGNEDFGQSVKISSDGTIVAAGAPRADNGGTSSGEVRVYELSS